MTNKELINKLMELPLNENIGITIRKKVPYGEVIYVACRGDIKITGQEQIGDPRGIWLEGEIKDWEDMEILHRYGEGSGIDLKVNIQ